MIYPSTPSRKGQGMPINVLIGAIIGLIVLIVVAAIFSGKVQFFSKNTQSCESQYGNCISKESCQKEGGRSVLDTSTCKIPNVCCVNPFKEKTP